MQLIKDRLMTTIHQLLAITMRRQMGHTIIFLLLSIFFGCSKAEDRIDDEFPNRADIADYENVSSNLVERHLIGGFGVITLKPDGQPEHQGEALIWGGTALWAMSCDSGAGISAALADMINREGGQMIRVDPLGEYAVGREVTFDGAVGAFMGIARRVIDCDEKELWKEPFEKLLEFQNSHGDRLHANVKSKLVGEFKYVRELIAYNLDLRDEPDEERLRDLEKIIGGWALAVQLAHNTGQGSDACYRINLGLSTFKTLETLGKSISDLGRNQFCENTKGMSIPTVDHFCGRENISVYLSNYNPASYEYRHQRCGEPWETADGNGNTSHQLDKIVAYVFTNGWHSLQN